MQKRIKILVVMGALALSAWAQDQCKPIGWATKSGRTATNAAVTGGGSATPIVVKTYADLEKHAKGSDAKVIHIDGTLGGGWSGTTGDRLNVGSNKTIVGLRAGTQLKAPIRLNNSVNVIIRNLVIKGPGSNSDQAWDNIIIEGSSKNVWIDHCEFWDGQDGNSDAVKGADNITYSWNIFGYTKNSKHNFSNLIASSDNEPVSEGKLNITYVGNWFRGIAQRGPRCRYGNVHVVNNLYTTDGLQSDYAISAGKDCQVITEKNHFINIKTPIYTNHKAGTSAHYVKDNIFENTSGNKTGYGNAFTVPYDQSFVIPAANVKAAVERLAGATLNNPNACATGSSSSSATAVSSSSINSSSSAIAVSSSAAKSSSSAAQSSSSAAEIPRPTVAQCGAAECASVLQGEDFCAVDGVFETKNGGFMDRGYVNVDNELNSAVSYKIAVSADYSGSMYVRYANGVAVERAVRILSGENVLADSVVFASTGVWTSWVELAVPVNLTAGVHDLRIVSLTEDGAPNIDWLGWENATVQTTVCEAKPTTLNTYQTVPQVKFSTSQLQLYNMAPAQVQIYNLHGKLLQSHSAVRDVLPLQNLNSGRYIVKIRAANLNVSEIITQP